MVYSLTLTTLVYTFNFNMFLMNEFLKKCILRDLLALKLLSFAVLSYISVGVSFLIVMNAGDDVCTTSCTHTKKGFRGPNKVELKSNCITHSKSSSSSQQHVHFRSLRKTLKLGYFIDFAESVYTKILLITNV